MKTNVTEFPLVYRQIEEAEKKHTSYLAIKLGRRKKGLAHGFI